MFNSLETFVSFELYWLDRLNEQKMISPDGSFEVHKDRYTLPIDKALTLLQNANWPAEMKKDMVGSPSFRNVKVEYLQKEANETIQRDRIDGLSDSEAKYGKALRLENVLDLLYSYK
jgi:hypothetical protein